MSKLIRRMSGEIHDMDFPPDAICTCGHSFEEHTVASNTDVCSGCDPCAGAMRAFHFFAPRGPFNGSASAERAAYEAAMGRVAQEESSDVR